MLVALVYPHQLFESNPALEGAEAVVLVEEPLFFTQFRFHSWKLALHRASMETYERELVGKGKKVHYLKADQLESTQNIAKYLKELGVSSVQVVALNDDWLQWKLEAALGQAGIEMTVLDDPHFLTPLSEFVEIERRKKGRWFFTEFYVSQRKRLGLLLDDQGKPVGGKWTFDTDNRKKLPKGLVAPRPRWQVVSEITSATISKVRDEFPQAYGAVDQFCYPTSRTDARRCLDDFLDHRLKDFGIYEDAIDTEQIFLFHSVLTPALNIGLLSPAEVVAAALERQDEVPLNSLEGFVRQIIGWREYIRGVYFCFGRRQRTRNFWNHHLPMPKAFYDGTTGIEPVDTVIRRVLKYSYCHHIERLMILGNFMLLCEIDPDEVYRWFMELFIDAYDWVMVPNVYGMSQYADGGLITTKPYLSGSAYIRRMSNFKPGPWCEVWDALYWRFVDVHRDFFASNPRLSIMAKQCDRLGDRLKEHHRRAEEFLEQIHRG